MSKYTSPKIFKPDTRLIGVDSSAATAAAAEQRRQDMIETVKHNYDNYKEYNKNILALEGEEKEMIGRLSIRPNNVLVRLFKHEADLKTKGGIILDDYELMQTEGGQIKARVNANPYQERGVVIKASEDLPDGKFYKDLKEGTIVHLATAKLAPFKLDKSLRGESIDGFYLMNVAAIDAIEL